ncbi:MAG TPA: hypothetical protein VF147_13455, partial [Vicinamibacterales bacterium]
DIVEHQHRRELRALRVFGAWTNLTDLKAGNTLDTLVTSGGRKVVRHYLQDVGSTFGIGANGPHDWDEGFEYFYEGDSTLRRMMTFGFALAPWQTTPYKIYPSVGRFESEAFDPKAWRPHAATVAYLELLPDDAFWAARRVAAFDDERVRAAVHAGQYSDPAAEQHLAAILIARREKVARAYLADVNPIVNPTLADDGRLTFDNAAVSAGVAPPPVRYRAVWSSFDNATGTTAPLGETTAERTVIDAPRTLSSNEGTFVQVQLSAESAAHPQWGRALTVHFRRTGDRWTLVGLDRGIGGR